MSVTDYDTPRRGTLDDTEDVSLERLTAARNRGRRGPNPADEPGWDSVAGTAGTDPADTPGLTGLDGIDPTDLAVEELMPVVPKQAGEFTCSRCFMVYPMNRAAHKRNRRYVCRDCD